MSWFNSFLKLLRSWKFVFIMSVLILYIIYVGALYSQDIKLPSEGWSRSLTIEKLKPQDSKDIIKTNNIFTITNPTNNEVITAWYHNNKFNYYIINSTGDILSKNEVKLSGVKPDKVFGKIDGNYIQIYTIEDDDQGLEYEGLDKVKEYYDDLINYTIDMSNNEIISTTKIQKNVKDFKIIEDTLIYTGYNIDTKSMYIGFHDKNGTVKTIDNIEVKNFEVVDYKDKYLLALHEAEARSTGYLKFISYNNITKETNDYEMAAMPFMDTGNVDIGIVNDRINIMVPSLDKKNNRVVTYVYDFALENPTDFSRKSLNLNGEPKIIRNERSVLKFVAQDTVYKGSNSTKNIRMYTFKDGRIVNISLLTKTDKVSDTPNYFTLGEYDYMQWIDKSGGNKTILISSNNEEIVNKSSYFTFTEWTVLFFNTLISLLSVGFMAVIPILTISVPVVMLIVIGAAIKIYWMENNPIKVLIFAISVHTIAKIIYFKYVLDSKMNLKEVLPSFLKSTTGLIGVIAIGTIISLYCVINYIRSNSENKHFFGTYIIYSIIDITMITLMIYPYLYSFMAFGYLTRG